MGRKPKENAIKCHFQRFKNVKRICLIILTLLLAFGASAQKRKVQNRPYIDQRRWHYGFLAGIHVQDYKLVNTGYVTEDGQSWFADVPEYSTGFTVGVLGELYLNQFLSLRLVPTLHFGDNNYRPYLVAGIAPTYDFSVKKQGGLIGKAFRLLCRSRVGV